MLDVAVAYNRYRFLGDEFLTWIWFQMETDDQQSLFKSVDADLIALEMGNRIVLENRRDDTLERITIKGEEANLAEGRLALRKGALVAEISLNFRSSDASWQFSLKGESLNLSNFKTPKIALPEGPEDLEGFVLEKAYLYDKILQFIEKIYILFIKERLSTRWSSAVVPGIKKWMTST
jgi:hypothetical protein